MKKAIIGIITVILLLLAISSVMIYDTSGIFAQDKYHDENFFLKKQLLWLGLGFITFVFFSYFRYVMLRKLSFFFIVIVIGLLFLTMIKPFACQANGAYRWVKIGPLVFQPSEIAKLVLCIYLADLLSRKQEKVKEFFKSLFFPSILIAFILFLVVRQPDLGTTVLLATICVLLFFIAGMKTSIFVSIILSGMSGLYFLIIMFPYRMKRIMTFLDPFKDPQGSGFQIIQSFIALGSGGLYGMGLGQSKQKLFYLPEAHTDFIFSIIGEEFGLIGTCIIVFLFLTFFLCGMIIAYKCIDPFGKLLAVAITLTISIQAMINICVVTGMLPTKGIPLPFLSFGGSNLLINIASIGILVNIGVRGNNYEPVEVIKDNSGSVKLMPKKKA